MTRPPSPLTMLLARHTNRREFITLLGGAAAWPLAARAQQPAMPVIGFLSSRAADTEVHLVAAFRQGLNDLGYVEGQNLTVDYRWAEGQYDRLPALAADLVRRQVTVIVATGGARSALAAKAATETIPIVFTTGDDPVKLGLVASLNQPGGNATGVAVLVVASLLPKRMQLLRELVPTASTMALLINPTSAGADRQLAEAPDVARALGVQLDVVQASTASEIDLAFGVLARRRPGALLVGADPFFQVRREQLVAMAARHAIPAMYEWREFVDAGGLIAYSTRRTESMRQMGIYAGRILKGAKPADLPVVQSARFELVINLRTAQALGLTVPPTLLATADEVIE